MGKSKKTTTQKQDNTIDPFTKRHFETGQSNVRSIMSNSPFRAYEGPRVAGLTDQQMQARDYLQNTMGAGRDSYAGAQATAQQAGNYAPEHISAGTLAGTDLAPYMNPYIGGVLGNAMRSLSEQHQGNLNDIGARAAQAGAFGGSRHGVVESLANRDYLNRGSELASNLYAQGFDRATGLANQDISRTLSTDQFNASRDDANVDRQLNVGQFLAGLSQRQGAETRANAGLLNQFGSQEQFTRQAGLDAAYQEHLRAQDDPFKRAQMELGLLGQVPRIVDSTGTTTQSSRPGFAGILGAAMKGLSHFYNPAAGAV